MNFTVTSYPFSKLLKCDYKKVWRKRVSLPDPSTQGINAAVVKPLFITQLDTLLYKELESSELVVVTHQSKK